MMSPEPISPKRSRYITDLIRTSPFIRHNFVFFLGSLSVAVLNYLYYPVLGRVMEPADFGEVQVLISLFTQASVLFGVLNYVAIHVTVNSHSEAKRNQILGNLEQLTILLGSGLLLITLLLVGQLKAFLNFTEIWPFVALILALVVTLPLSLRMAFLRGRKLFVKSSVADGSGSAAKIALGVVLVLIGWHSFGAIIGLALSQALSLGMVVYWARQAGLNIPRTRRTRLDLSGLRPQLRYALAVCVASSSVLAMLSLDIISIKHYFSPETAGLYAGMAVVARIVYFVSAPFTGVLVTLVSLRQSMRKNRLQLQGTLALTAGLGGAAVLGLSALSNFSVKLLVGSDYLAYADQLPKLALVMLLLALSNAILVYQIALHRYRFCFTPLASALLTICLIYFRHTTISVVVSDVLLGSFVLLLATCAQIVLSHSQTEE